MPIYVVLKVCVSYSINIAVYIILCRKYIKFGLFKACLCPTMFLFLATPLRLGNPMSVAMPASESASNFKLFNRAQYNGLLRIINLTDYIVVYPLIIITMIDLKLHLIVPLEG